MIFQVRNLRSKALTQGIRVPFRPYPGILSGVGWQAAHTVTTSRSKKWVSLVRMSILKHLAIQNVSEFIEKDLLGELMPRRLEFAFQFLWLLFSQLLLHPIFRGLLNTPQQSDKAICKATKNGAVSRVAFKGINPNLTTKYNE